MAAMEGGKPTIVTNAEGESLLLPYLLPPAVILSASVLVVKHRFWGTASSLYKAKES